MTYLFFSHTIKGQPYNMKMLRRLLERGCTLLDYELVTDDAGQRTIAFGRFAGLAGAIDTLWALGQRFREEGVETPFADVRQSLEHEDLAAAKEAVQRAGQRIASEGLPAELGPIAIAVTGAGGKVFGGAMELLQVLPHRVVSPADLPEAMRAADPADSRRVLLVPYGPGDLVEPVDPARTYTWEDYLHHPDRYRSRFGQDLESLTAIVHGIFWRKGYPRFLLRDDVRRLYANGTRPRLRLVTDVTCDLDGSDELLLRTTDPGAPTYVVDPDTFQSSPGFAGRGPVVLAIDILPAELPRDASRTFSVALVELAMHLATDRPFPSAQDPSVPGPLRRSLIALRGELVDPWDQRLAEPLAQHGGEVAS
jgi:alpha-aminoadipic semialdehyde synthase